MSSLWKIVYHTCDKRLTYSDPQTAVPSATQPDFQGAATPRSCYLPGIALAQSSNEAPVAESSGDDAVCSHEYETSVWRSSLDFDCGPFPAGRRHYLRPRLCRAPH